MFFALDENNIRVNAEDGVFKRCVCPACGSPVIQKRVDTNRHHFAHDSRRRTVINCPYDCNTDYKNMSEWHIRMQEYFPKETRERIFTDKKTGEKHIADVYIEESNTVLEFQYSSLKKKEFLDRTMFHLDEGRKIVWLFDESWKEADEESYNKQYYKNGKLVKENNRRAKGPYESKSFRWLYRRKFVEEGPPIYCPCYSVCLYTGAEGDVFHRIISLHENSVIVSLHDIAMSKELNVEDFFVLETFWQEQEPWKSDFEAIEGAKPFSKFDSLRKHGEKLVSLQELDVLEIIEESHQTKRDTAEARRLHREEIERRDREDYWKALLEHFG